VGQGLFRFSTRVGRRGPPNLAAWVSIQTNSPPPDPNVALPTNVFNFTDFQATNFPYRFFRAVQQP
jgi:hypothetical protein